MQLKHRPRRSLSLPMALSSLAKATVQSELRSTRRPPIPCALARVHQPRCQVRWFPSLPGTATVRSAFRLRLFQADYLLCRIHQWSRDCQHKDELGSAGVLFTDQASVTPPETEAHHPLEYSIITRKHLGLGFLKSTERVVSGKVMPMPQRKTSGHGHIEPTSSTLY